MQRLVLDTNVVLDLLHFADPAAFPILAALEAGRACCFADDATLEELTRVAAYPEFRLAPMAAEELVKRYRKLAQVLGPIDEALPKLPRCRDRDDQKFLELAYRSEAHMLVSKDKALLKLKGRTGLGFRIATPAAAGVWLTAPEESVREHF